MRVFVTAGVGIIITTMAVLGLLGAGTQRLRVLPDPLAVPIGIAFIVAALVAVVRRWRTGPQAPGRHASDASQPRHESVRE